MEERMPESSHANYVYHAIEAHLNSPQIRENLTPLFCETLLWGQTTAAPFTREVTVRRGEKATIPFVPVAQLSGLPVFRVDWPYEKPPTVTQRRAVYRALAATYIEHLLVYVTANDQQATFVWARQRGGATSRGKVEMRALPYTVGAAARTTIERLGELAFTREELGLFGEPPLTAVTDKLNAAFDVEAVTQAFFTHYQRVFKALRQILNEASQDVPIDVDGPTDVGARWVHDYALQTLNRLMFLYFVQRKGWLGGDPAFIATFWRAYRASDHPPDTFFTDWLSVLFFEAFNNQFQAGRADYQQRFPPAIREALAMAPYLNGGLFTRNNLDRAHDVALPDALFTTLFDRFEGRAPGFLERYNFTITESTPFDIEVAVDPEMIGKVYESLVNVSEEADERGEAGIFYTPRVEIDLMCRLALVDWLAHHVGREHKPPLYTAVFALEEEDKAHADDALMQHNLWPQLSDLLDTVTVVDPACGSGSFLVGMLQVLDDLVARADAQLGRERTPYERRKRIIGHSLYGVDVMDWAVHVAELRLWLQLVIETELAQAELKFRPLLPNLSFKVRPGDSLVQEVGGINLALRQGSRLIPPQVKGRITRLKGEKLKFYNNDPYCAYTSAAQLRQAEVALFRDILDARIQAIDRRLRAIDDALRPQVNLFGEEQTTQMALDRVGLEREREQLMQDRDQVTRAREALRLSSRDFQIAPQATVPFVWDIAFVEVFEGERAGFDIVIGNPPYVRQEAIHDPRTPPDEITRASKRAYKGKLARAVYAAWPRTFGYDFVKDKPRWKLAARSDLYIYFYLHGLSLLNDQGAFCFITSNAWLDVGYGKDLQQFLLTRGQVKLVLDNQVRRSFASADVNTVIVLLGPAHDTKSARQASLRHTARFVMLTVPFEDVLTPTIWEEVERARTRQTTPAYRVFPLTQADLLEKGMDEKQRFSGDKWGGKYLRAPDIYWVIIEKARDKLVHLGDIADVRFGIKTGANAFFYLDEETIAQWGIEEEFLVPFLFSLKEVDRYEVDPQTLQKKLFYCHVSKPQLSKNGKSNVLAYIEWGEDQGFHKRPSVRNRTFWYALPEQPFPEFVSNRFLGERFGFPWIDKLLVGDVFFVGNLEKTAGFLGTALLNASMSFLSAEVIARKTYGIGVAYLYGPEINNVNILNPELLNETDAKAVKNIFERMCHREMLKISDEIHQSDRRALDAIIFDVLGLTQGERDAVYEALVTMVEARLHKAQSLR
jgi:hypothetical protein